jgi:hypothetical protein
VSARITDLLQRYEDQNDDLSEEIQSIMNKSLTDSDISISDVSFYTNSARADMDLSEKIEEMNDQDVFDGITLSQGGTCYIDIEKDHRTDGGYEKGTSRRYSRRIVDRIGRSLIWGVLSSSEDRPNDNTSSDTERRALHAEKDFLDRFAAGTKLYGFLGLLVPAAIWGVDIALCGQVPNILPGLVMELAGAWVLARAVLVGPKQMLNISTSGFGGPTPAFRKALAEDAADGIWGVSLLVLGIVVQSIASAGIPVPTWIC